MLVFDKCPKTRAGNGANQTITPDVKGFFDVF
jgi:hypothetical protein